ncbi:MAG: VOC family protein [Actinomycetota bacterium]|nr:VOC family protein [Actinomycetota bacterium]
MAVELNHTIVACRDKATAAASLAELLGLPAPKPFGPFMIVELANGVSLDFMSVDHEIHPQHYAFLLSEPEFDEVFGRITAQGMDYWADPAQQHPGEINTRDGGRGCYFPGADGHFLEILTRPYGSGGP